VLSVWETWTVIGCTETAVPSNSDGVLPPTEERQGGPIVDDDVMMDRDGFLDELWHRTMIHDALLRYCRGIDRLNLVRRGVSH
jgi:hypothetical protein